jgi:vancomycin aglycone glucosyltransferase
MRVLLSTYGSRGDVEPMVGLAAALTELGAQARVCAPPDFADLLARAGLPFTPAGQSVREMVRQVFAGRTPPPSAAELAGGVVAAQFDAVAAAAGGCDVIVASGLIPAVAGARAVSEKLGLPYVFAAFCPCYLPSPWHPPMGLPGRPVPPEVTDNQVLWELNAQGLNEVFGPPVNAHRASVGLPAVDHVRDYVFTSRPWLAADPVLAPWREPADPVLAPGREPADQALAASREPADLDVLQTGAWIWPDERPLPAELEAFLDAGPPPVYVGFGSIPLREKEQAAQAVIEAIRAQGRRVLLGSGWADLALTDDQDDCFAVGEVSQQALFRRVAAVVHHGGAGTTATAARAGAPQVVVAQAGDQPYWARRVTELGIGTAHDGPAPAAGSLSAALKIALAPGTAARAAAVAGQVRTDGAQLAAQRLLDLIGRRVPA